MGEGDGVAPVCGKATVVSATFSQSEARGGPASCVCMPGVDGCVVLGVGGTISMKRWAGGACVVDAALMCRDEPSTLWLKGLLTGVGGAGCVGGACLFL